jgi:type I restriction enzyme S subunit
MDVAAKAGGGEVRAAGGLRSLPQGWSLAKVADVVEHLTDGTHQPPKFEPSGIPFVVIGNISNGRIDWSSVRKWVSLSTYENESKRLCPSRDDVLYTAVGSYGRAIRVLDDRQFMFQRHIAYLRPNKALIEPSYLCYALNSPELKLQADQAARGVAQKTVTLGSLRDFVIPVAPLAEQRRIVARIGELFSEISEGEAALAESHKGLATFRRALLKAAVTGELTKDWRATNSVAVIGRDVLAELVRNQQSKNGRPKNNSEGDEMSAPFELPKGWAWARIEDVGSVQLGRQRAPQHHAGQHMRPYLRVANVFEDRVDLSDVKEMNFTPDEFEVYRLRDGDVLLNEGQTPDLLGRPAIWRDQIPGCCFQNTLIRFRAKEPVTPE